MKQNAAAAEATAEMDGVDYDPIAGANCPHCYMQKIGVRNTLPWEGGLRVRYHICGRCGKTVKSVEKWERGAEAATA